MPHLGCYLLKMDRLAPRHRGPTDFLHVKLGASYDQQRSNQGPQLGHRSYL
jgi:hypothetical protein